MSNTETIVHYSQGDTVIYKNNGICKVSQIQAMSFTPGDEKTYYVLEPVYAQGSRMYVPVDSAELNACMRRLLNKNEIDTAIDESTDQQLEWVEDTKLRAAYWAQVISTYDRAKILAVFARLSDHKIQLEQKRKKMYASDQKMLALTERMIRDEFAFVLKIDRDEVMAYITDRLSRSKAF